MTDTSIAARTALPAVPEDCIETTTAVELLSESLAAAGTSARRLTLVCAPTATPVLDELAQYAQVNAVRTER